MVSGDELRSAMRRFPAGVAVVTVVHDEQRFGITVGSLVSLSLEPPLVGIAVGHQASIYEPLRRTGRWALSILAHDQEALAQHFARSGMPPLVAWAGVALRPDARGGAPLIDGALAWVHCETSGEHRAGDHTFFVGSVTDIELGRDERGLTYARGRYAPS